MNTMVSNPEIRQSLKPVVNRASVYRYLGYPDQEAANRRLLDTLHRCEERLPSLLKPQGIFCRCRGETVFARDFPLVNREVYVAIVTIGKSLEQEAERLAAEGEVLESFVLDTLGSVYAEGTAEGLYRELAAEADAEGITVGCRISPGYGEWALEEQHAIFTLLPADRIEVTLTPGLMMRPRKSISFASERAKFPLRLREGDQCKYCEFDRCRFRRSEYKGERQNHT